MKDILIDIYKIKNLYSGLGQYAINYANELMRQSSEEFNFNFLIPQKLQLEKPEFWNLKNFSSTKLNLQKRYFPQFNKPYDVWHSLQQFPSCFPNKKSKFILTIHDLNFLIEKNEEKKLKYLKKLQENVDRADYITTISDFTKETIESHINLRGKTIRTIYNGIMINPQGANYKPNFADDRKFFFSIGIFNKKKNFHVLLPIMEHFKDYKLIIAGDKNTSYGEQVQQQIKDMNLEDQVILAGKIDESEKIWLYSHCEAFLFPSLAEGFGMPVIEAMKFGKAVFIGKITSLPEIGGNFAFYFDNFDEEYMSLFVKSKLLYYKENQEILSEQIKEHANKFSWQTCISQYLNLYHEISNQY